MSRPDVPMAWCEPPPASDESDEVRCVTCGDIAVEALVVELDRDTAVVKRSGLREEVAVDLVPDVAVGDFVLCHAGVALERLDRAPPEIGGNAR